MSLHGLVIMTTRAASQGADLRAALESRGAQVVEVPCIATVPVADPEAFEGATWLVVTSPNGARALAAQPPVTWPRVAAVGPGTAATLAARGVPVSLVAEQADGLGLAQTLIRDGAIAGQSVVLVRGDRASADLPAALRAAGAHVRDVCAYRTVRAPELDDALARALSGSPPDWVVLASGSAFDHLLAAWPAVLACRLAVIGPRTREAVERVGGQVAAQAERPDAEAIADAIARKVSQ